MTITGYSPRFDEFLIGCSCDEVETELMPYMMKWEADNFHKKRREGDLPPERHFKSIREIFANRDLELTIESVHKDDYQSCDQVEIHSLKQLKRLCVTHDGGVPFPDQPEKRRLFFDMDGVLVDFDSARRRIDPEILAQHDGKLDGIKGIFTLMDPMPGAIEAARTLNRYYDCFILSTSPWRNTNGCSEKMEWIQRYVGDIFYKKVIFTHRKDLLSDGESILIDDRIKNGSDKFGKNLIKFDINTMTWKEVTDRLVAMAKEEGAGIGCQNN